nr:hypothetical protein [Tanacetum cinerariifolium]
MDHENKELHKNINLLDQRRAELQKKIYGSWSADEVNRNTNASCSLSTDNNLNAPQLSQQPQNNDIPEEAMKLSSDLGGATRQRVCSHAMFDAALSVPIIVCPSQRIDLILHHSGLHMLLSVLAAPFVLLLKATCCSAIFSHEWLSVHMIGQRKEDTNQLSSPPIAPPEALQMVSSIKLPIIKKEVPPVTAQQILARTRERKAKSTLVMAIPDEHLARFHGIKDAKTLWDTIKTRFGEGLDKRYDRFQRLLSLLKIHGTCVSTEDANQKFLRFLPLAWSNISLIMRNKPGIDNLDIDDLYNNLKVYEADIKSSSRSSSNLQNVAFVFVESTSSTNELNAAYSVSTATCHSSQAQEMDLKWQVAMLSIRVKRFYKKTSRKLEFNGKEPVGFDKTKVECFNYHRRWYFARDYRTDMNLRNRGRDAGNARYRGRDNGKRPARKEDEKALVVQDGLVIYEEKIRVPEYDVKDKRNLLKYTQKQLDEALREKEDLKAKLEKFETSSKNIIKLLDSQVSAKVKTGLGYDSQFNEKEVLDVKEEEVTEIVFDNRSSDEENTLANDMFKKDRMAKKTVLPNNIRKGTGHRESRPVWNNFQRINHQNKFAPTTVFTRSERIPVSAAKPKAAASTSVAKPVNTAGPKQSVNFSNSRTISVVKGNEVTAVKALAGYVWRPRGHPQQALKNKEIVNSGCSRHMTRNKASLADYQKINDGDFVTFGLSKGVVSSGDLTCLFAKASIDESNLWHIRLGHVNFKTMNKLVKGNLVRGLPSKIFKNNHTCVACQKGNLHKATCKGKLLSSISPPLQMLHMDLFGPTSVMSINQKKYCLVVTDDFSRFSWVFLLATKDETSKKNRVAERKNKTLIEAARTMQADSLLPITFWAEAVNTACYVLNRALVTKHHNKTPYELLNGRSHRLDFMRPFGCPVTILNTLDPLGKFDGKADEGFLVRYSVTSKAFRGIKLTKMQVPQDTNGNACTQDNVNAGKKVSDQHYILLPLWSSISSTYKSSADKAEDDKPKDDTYSKTIVEPVNKEDQAYRDALDRLIHQEKEASDATDSFSKEFEQGCMDQRGASKVGSTNYFNTVSNLVNAASTSGTFSAGGPSSLHPDAFIPDDTLLHMEPKKVAQALDDESWVEAMQDENKKYERVIVVRNKARLVAQGHKQEKRINYDEVFAPVARIEAIRIFLAFASFMGFIVYQMDVKSVFLYDTIEEEVYVSQPPGFMDPQFPHKNGYRRGIIDKILFIKTDEDDIMLVQVFQVTPKLSHLHAVKRIFRYLKGQPKLGLWYHRDSSFDLETYLDSDYAGASLDMKSTTGGCQFLRKRLIPWQCKKQTIVATFTIEAEYVAAAN